MSANTFLYSVHTRGGITFYIEAANRREAEARATDPAIAKAVFAIIRNEFSRIESVESHRGPAHAITSKLIFRDMVFRK